MTGDWRLEADRGIEVGVRDFTTTLLTAEVNGLLCLRERERMVCVCGVESPMQVSAGVHIACGRGLPSVYGSAKTRRLPCFTDVCMQSSSSSCGRRL